ESPAAGRDRRAPFRQRAPAPPGGRRPRRALGRAPRPGALVGGRMHRPPEPDLAGLHAQDRRDPGGRSANRGAGPVPARLPGMADLAGAEARRSQQGQDDRRVHPHGVGAGGGHHRDVRRPAAPAGGDHPPVRRDAAAQAEGGIALQRQDEVQRLLGPHHPAPPPAPPLAAGGAHLGRDFRPGL
ncbi:MAG: hypothetical protein AVDCRST_MAG89-2328, partial [uncultured Gemmatimonadetes bacterium]